MPANVVKTPRDEHLWDLAKERAKEEGRAEDWPYVMGIFEHMKGNRAAARAAFGLVLLAFFLPEAFAVFAGAFFDFDFAAATERSPLTVFR